MNTDNSTLKLLHALKGFHGRFKTIYGQAAMKLDNDTYLISGDTKPFAGVYEEDIITCDINSGDLGEIFRKRTDISAFIFAINQDIVRVSEELVQLPVALEDMAQLSGSSVQVISDASPQAVLQGLKSESLCLVKGVGAIVTGNNIREVVANTQVLAKSCEAYIHGRMIGGIKPIDSGIASWLRQTYSDQYLDINDTPHVDYIGFEEEEFRLRSQLIDFGTQMIRDDLAYGYSGNLSIKQNAETMLITPSSMDYFDIDIEDIVSVNIKTLDHGNQRVPSSDEELHARMYQSLPGCNAIIHTHSNACSVFAACEAGFAVPDPAMQKLIGDIKVIPYTPGDPDVSMNNLIATLSETHAAIMPHHGAIFYGPSIDVVYEIAKTVEYVARNLLNYNAKSEDGDENQE